MPIHCSNKGPRKYLSTENDQPKTKNEIEKANKLAEKIKFEKKHKLETKNQKIELLYTLSSLAALRARTYSVAFSWVRRLGSKFRKTL